MPEHQRRAFLASLDPGILEMIAREEWFWVARPEQHHPDGDWSIWLMLGGRGTGKTRAGAEWITKRTLDYPLDASGFPTERLIMAFNISDAVASCAEGPSGVLRVLQRQGFQEVLSSRRGGDGKDKYTFTKSPKPYIRLLETGAVIHFTGATIDAARSKNLADVWCVARGEPVSTSRGLVPIQEVVPGDQVWTSQGWSQVLRSGRTKRDARVLRIVADSGSVRVTPDHMVWANDSWIRADRVVAGDTMTTCLDQMNPSPVKPPPSTNGTGKTGTTTRMSAAGSTGRSSLPTSVLRVELETELSDVYDLTVAGAHEFFAGTGLVKIHNCDEPIKWSNPEETWREGIRPALRADIPGDKPRALVTTTPKPIPLLRNWVNDPQGFKVHITRSSTFDNMMNLSADAVRELRLMYEGTNLGRQELYGELIDDVIGALFSYSVIHANRVELGPVGVAHRTVGVDPGLTGGEEGDETGVIVACRDREDSMFVLADETTKLSGRDAAIHAWQVFERWGADTLVYESNLGKAWMHQVFTDAFRELQKQGVFPSAVVTPPLVPVFSTQGKKLRAEPVAMRYSQGRVHHVGVFRDLEDQMLTFDPLSSKASPDRLDALVHAIRHLMDGERRRTRLLTPLGREVPELGYDPIGKARTLGEFGIS